MPASSVAQLSPQSLSRVPFSRFHLVRSVLPGGASPQQDREARLPIYLSLVGSRPLSPSLGAHTDIRRQGVLLLSSLSPRSCPPQLLSPPLLKYRQFNFLFV